MLSGTARSPSEALSYNHFNHNNDISTKNSAYMFFATTFTSPYMKKYKSNILN